MNFKSAIPRVYLHYKFNELVGMFFKLLFSKIDYKPVFSDFENKLKKITDSNNILPTSSASNAFHLLLSVLNFPHGSEIIMSPITVESFIKIILYHGLKPVFVDVNKENYLADIEQVKSKISPKTKAILVTPLFGWYGGMQEFRDLTTKKNLILIEDCAQAFGCTYNDKFSGTWGDFGLYSFGPVKFPTGISGGAILFQDSSWREILIKKINSFNKPNRIRLIKDLIRFGTIWCLLKKIVFNIITFRAIKYGLSISSYLKHFQKKSDIVAAFMQKTKYDDIPMIDIPHKEICEYIHSIKQLHEQPNKPNISMILNQLLYYKKIFQQKIKNAEFLYNKLNENILNDNLLYLLPYPPTDHETHNFWQFALRVKNKKHFIQYMQDNKIDVSGLVFLRSYNKDLFGINAKYLIEADSASDEIIYIPIFPNLSEKNMNYISEKILYYFNTLS
ncbi:DegT/DnrJ/EryC1/StrS aminotransferase [Candidatus Magnetomorum sp. HK-1]|nr:DegT/DnrJ/EryC1/StrS aminotransferase [Candidatus Magnetomorum sp. HK-1]